MLNEKIIVDKIIEDGFSGGFANWKDIALLAKYYRWELGYGDRRIRSSINRFCEDNDKNFNSIRSRDMVWNATRQSKRYKLRDVKDIGVTLKEVKNIQSAKDFKHQKLLFVLLVFSKALKHSYVSTKPGRRQFGYSVSNSLVKNVIDAAKISIPSREFFYIVHELYKLELVRPTYSDTIKLMFVDEKSKPVIIVDDTENIISFYVNYCGGEIGYCQECGDSFVKEKNINRYKFCDVCAMEVRRLKTRDRVRKHRIKAKKNVTLEERTSINGKRV